MHEPLLQTPQERGAGAKDCMVRCSESMAGATGCWGPDKLIRLGPYKVARQTFDMYAFPHLRAFTSKIMNLTGSSEGQGGVRRPTHLAQPAKLDCVKEVGPTAYKRTPCGGGSQFAILGRGHGVHGGTSDGREGRGIAAWPRGDICPLPFTL